MSALFRSRKFCTMLLDVAVGLVAYFIARYAAEDIATDVMMVIGLMQPVVLAVIAGWAIEDAAAKRAGIFAH